MITSKKIAFMEKKRIFCFIFFILIVAQICAQPGRFSIKITQVYPGSSIVHSSNYNLSSELEKAEASLRSQYSVKDANYVMELVRPSGKDTKVIQNIKWIRITNGKKENLKTNPPRPDLNQSYQQATVIKIYACNNDGTEKANQDNYTAEFNCRFMFFKDAKDVYTSAYMSRSKCEDLAKEYFTNHQDSTTHCEIKLINIEGNSEGAFMTNLFAYQEYIEKQNRKTVVRDPVVVEIDTTGIAYDKKNIDERLKLLQLRANRLRKGFAYYRQEMNIIIEQADDIIAIMKHRAQEFKRDKYFEGDLDDLKRGIKELIKINKKSK